MTGTKHENKQWPDPKDYGLPVVEIKPLETVYPGAGKEEVLLNHPHAEPTSGQDVKQDTAVPPIAVTSDEEGHIPPKEPLNPTKESVEIIPEKQSNLWIWMAAVTALLLVSVIIWQMNGGMDSGDDTKGKTTAGTLPKQEGEEVKNQINDEVVEENQSIDSQSVVVDSISSSAQAANSAQTGTTIDSNPDTELIRITEKGDRVHYFIIVGSLPNESLATKEAANYMGRTGKLYLIMPYDDVKNYRLAIGSFPSFNRANEELERVKGEYKEALWILKY